MDAKEGDMVLDSGVPKEEKSPISNLEIKSENEIIVKRACETENKMKVRDDDLVLDVSLQNKNGFTSSDMMISIDEYGGFSKIEIKGEPWWQEGELPVVKTQPKASPVSEMHCEIKDEANEDLLAADSTRLHTETASSTYGTTTCLLTAAYLEEKCSLRQGKNGPGFAGATRHEVYENDQREALCIDQIVHYHKLTPPQEHETNGKLTKHTKCSNKIHVCEISKKRGSQQNNLKPNVTHHESRRLYKYASENSCTCGEHLIHGLTHNDKISYRCVVCEESFTQMADLKSHILTHEGKRPFKCDFYEKSFAQPEALRKHIPIHEVKNAYKCKICEKSFTQIRDLKGHVLIHEGRSPYKCDVCEKSFSRSDQLKNHVSIHEGKRPYKCKICEKSFTQVRDLKGHILIHEGTSPYKCDVCEKSFTRNYHLKNHVLVHEDKRPYKCDVCEKSFTQMGALKGHILIHEGKRPYKCDVCEKSFTQMGGLKRHILIHDGKKPYSCEVCEKSFTQMGSLKRHIVIHEGKRP